MRHTHLESKIVSDLNRYVKKKSKNKTLQPVTEVHSWESFHFASTLIHRFHIPCKLYAIETDDRDVEMEIEPIQRTLFNF